MECKLIGGANKRGVSIFGFGGIQSHPKKKLKLGPITAIKHAWICWHS